MQNCSLDLVVKLRFLKMDRFFMMQKINLMIWLKNDTATESLTYTISDQVGAQSVGNVDVVITGVNDAPVAQSTLSVFEDEEVEVDVTQE